MKIRKARKEDLKDIDRIYVEGSIDEGRLQFPNVSINIMIKELEEAKKERLRGFIKEINDNKNHYWIVAVENSKIVGIGNAWLKSKDVGMIGQVYISKNYRGKRIGTSIIKELIRWLKSKKKKYIESGIYWNNKPSIKFHENLGFKPVVLKMRLK